jgi:hypothetical protein
MRRAWCSHLRVYLSNLVADGSNLVADGSHAVRARSSDGSNLVADGSHAVRARSSYDRRSSASATPKLAGADNLPKSTRPSPCDISNRAGTAWFVHRAGAQPQDRGSAIANSPKWRETHFICQSTVSILVSERNHTA